MSKSVLNEFDSIGFKIDSSELINGDENNDDTCSDSDVRAVEQTENNKNGDVTIENSMEQNDRSVSRENQRADVEEGGDFNERYDITHENTNNSNEADYNHFQTDITEIISKLIPKSDAGS